MIGIKANPVSMAHCPGETARICVLRILSKGVLILLLNCL